MKSKLKLTPWFTKGRPKRIGVYQASCQKENQSGDWYSYWNGKHFCRFSSSVEGALEYGEWGIKSGMLVGKQGSWRGLATPTGK